MAELHPDVVQEWDLRSQRVIVAELAILGLGRGRLPRIHVAPIPRFPGSERDLAVIVAGGALGTAQANALARALAAA